MTVRFRRILGAAGSTAVLVAVAVATFVGVSLVAGGGGDPPPYVADATPEPPRGPVPTQDPKLPGGFSVPTQGPPPTYFVEISDVVIPIPEGATYLYGQGPETRLLHRIWLGDSTVKFDDYGLTSADIKASENNVFEPTLDALWTLTQGVGTPSPPWLELNGVQVPLPGSSYYGTLENPREPDNPTFVVRLPRSVIQFNIKGLTYNGIEPADVGKFTATVEALGTVPAAD